MRNISDNSLLKGYNFRISGGMNFAFRLFGVTFMVVNAITFSSATIRDSNEENTLHPIVMYDITILTDEQRIPVDSFATEFADLVQDSDTLQDVFDISDTPATQYAEYLDRYIVIFLKELGENKSKIYADIATRSIGQNFKFFSRQSLLKVYANVVAQRIYFGGNLTQENANKYAQILANIIEKNANENVVSGNTTTKYIALSNGFVEFVKYIVNFSDEIEKKLCYINGGLWLMTAAEKRSSVDLYKKCISEGDEDLDESNSESGSSSSESGSSSSELGSSSSESASSSSESASSSSESGSSSSESGPSSSESVSCSFESK